MGYSDEIIKAIADAEKIKAESQSFYQKWKPEIIGVITIIIIVLIVKFFYGDSTKVTFADDSKWKAQLDSMVIKDRARDIRDKHVDSILAKNDSAIAAGNETINNLQDDFDAYRNTQNKINQKYEAQKRAVDAMPADARLKFFSDRLNKVSTNKNNR